MIGKNRNKHMYATRTVGVSGTGRDGEDEMKTTRWSNSKVRQESDRDAHTAWNTAGRRRGCAEVRWRCARRTAGERDPHGA